MILYLFNVLYEKPEFVNDNHYMPSFSVNLNFNLIILVSFILLYVLLCCASFNWWEVCFQKETSSFETIFVAGITRQLTTENKAFLC